MRNPHSNDEWLAICHKIVAQNAVGDGMVYLHVTRGNPGVGQGVQDVLP